MTLASRLCTQNADPVFLQAQPRLGVFRLIGFDEQIECLFCIRFGLGLPNAVYRGFGLWLR